jgi:hypothetical protein
MQNLSYMLINEYTLQSLHTTLITGSEESWKILKISLALKKVRENKGTECSIKDNETILYL